MQLNSQFSQILLHVTKPASLHLGKTASRRSERCGEKESGGTLADAADQVGGDVFVMDAAGGQVEDDVSGRSFPVTRAHETSKKGAHFQIHAILLLFHSFKSHRSDLVLCT